jgi:regulator of replication initiation timing
VTENNNQHQQMLLNEVNLLNVRINDLLNQLNRTVRLLFEENQKLTVELQQLKEVGSVKTEKIRTS